MAVKKNFIENVNSENKTITINWLIEPTEAEQRKFEYLMKAGYKMRDYSPEKAKAQAAKADKLDKKQILEALKGHEDLIKRFDELLTNKDAKGNKLNLEKSGFFVAKKWFKSAEVQEQLKK